MEQIRNDRIEELNIPRSEPKNLIVAGYVSALLGGLVGIFIGQYLAGYRKTLANGEVVFAHSNETRKQGRSILTLGTIVFVVLCCLILGKW